MGVRLGLCPQGVPLWDSWLLVEGSYVGVCLCRTGRRGCPPATGREARRRLRFSPCLSFPLFSPRIKGWWVSHHYVSTFLSGVMLTW